MTLDGEWDFYNIKANSEYQNYWITNGKET